MKNSSGVGSGKCKSRREINIWGNDEGISLFRDVAEMKADIVGLKADIVGLKDDNVGLKEAVERLNFAVAVLKEGTAH